MLIDTTSESRLTLLPHRYAGQLVVRTPQAPGFGVFCVPGEGEVKNIEHGIFVASLPKEGEQVYTIRFPGGTNLARIIELIAVRMGQGWMVTLTTRDAAFDVYVAEV
jgi:hypothetical protein